MNNELKRKLKQLQEWIKTEKQQWSKEKQELLRKWQSAKSWFKPRLEADEENREEKSEVLQIVTNRSNDGSQIELIRNNLMEYQKRDLKLWMNSFTKEGVRSGKKSPDLQHP